MAVDYDLVVVGNNTAARWAAIAAKARSARVALIAVAPDPIPHHLLLRQWAQTQSHPDIALVEWVKAITMKLQASRSPAKLASLGIEQIDGIAQFSKKPQFQVQVQNRVLRSRRYLLCLDADLPPPPMPGLPQWLSPADVLPRLDDPDHPLASPVLIVGDGPMAITLSQALGRLGYTVNLLSPHAHILPGEDAEAAFRVQAHLEADHVNIHTHHQIKAVTPSSTNPYQVATDQGLLIAESLVWAVEPTSAMINPNQVTVNLRHTSQGLWVNHKLQTSHPQIYACGSVLGGYTLTDIAHYEATVAVNNALGPKQSIDYATLPWVISSIPELARVGLTESQAQQTSRPFQILYHYYQQTEKGQLQDETGWCKVLVQTNGQILGAHVVGVGAAEIIHLVAVAMQKHCSISELAGLTSFGSSYGSIMGEIAQQWCHKQGKKWFAT